jgi:glycerophosphoryl diester phosphodiesterase
LIEPAKRAWQVLVQSFSEASLRRLRALEPGLPLIQLLEAGETPAAIVKRLDRISEYAVGIGPHFNRADAFLIDHAHRRCLVVHPYTVNQPGDQARLAAAGVDGMFSDFPDRLVATRPASEPRGTAAGAAACAARAQCLGPHRAPH